MPEADGQMCRFNFNVSWNPPHDSPYKFRPGGSKEGLIDMTKRNWTITALTVLLAIVLFGAGVILGQRLMFKAFGVRLRGVQATLLFDRIVQERGIK